MVQVQIRVVGEMRQAVEAAVMLLQTTTGVHVARWPRQGRKSEWLAYASLELPRQPMERLASG